MATYEFERVVDDSHMLVLPAEIPLGRIRVMVIAEDPQSVPSAAVSAHNNIFQDFLNHPPMNRTREELDAYLRNERDSWE